MKSNHLDLLEYALLVVDGLSWLQVLLEVGGPVV
jgi:hypothetical protein